MNEAIRQPTTASSQLSNLSIINARLPGYQDLQQIQINSQGIIAAIAPMQQSAQFRTNHSTIDVAGDWISLGGVDLQINGALGLAFPDLERQHLPLLQQNCEFLWNQGVAAFLPTIVTTSPEKIARSLSVIADFIANQPTEGEFAQILGVHLEGPFLNPQKRGAHPAEYLLPLTIENVERVLGYYASVVKLITLAPELDPTGEVIPYLRSLGITVSVGHSLATAAQAQQAFASGASMVTHAFNAMPVLHHREPGLLGAALVNSKVQCGLIADGEHITPTIIQLLLRASDNKEGIFLVSDALAPMGLSDGIYRWDSREIEVVGGTARLPDGTLAGTTLPLLSSVGNLVQWGICGVGEAIFLATEVPRQAIGLAGISPGQPAQLLRWNFEEATGKLTYQRL
ncbi:MAG: N-acetylglucosamine-6-phosphate deacetylase [Cyanobacteria bacterium QH_7_48_89]|nr:MAG: N-acetylglucosamine-6-phosphate deacetylase [Cyanobacteria bacterium QH_7_48_89]